MALVLVVSCGPFPSFQLGPWSMNVGITPRLAVPAYVYQPLLAYQQLAQNAPAVGLVVANLNSGPGTEASPEWAAAIEATHRAGLIVLGYVDTGYIGTTGHRTRQPTSSTAISVWRTQVREDIDNWYRFYGTSLDGVFLDQSPSLCGPTSGENSWVDFYIEVSRYVKDKHPRARIAVNPGRVPDECYTRAADTLVTFEGSYATYVDREHGYRTPSWAKKSRLDRTWHLVYGASQRDMADVIARATTANAGYVYVTSLTLPNPWATLPPDDYWNDQLARVGARVASKPPTVPGHLRTREVSFDRVSLEWDSSKDNVAVAAYDVQEETRLVATVHSTEVTLMGLEPATRYRFTVRARNPAGKVSAASAVEVTTRAADPAGPSGDERELNPHERSRLLTTGLPAE